MFYTLTLYSYIFYEKFVLFHVFYGIKRDDHDTWRTYLTHRYLLIDCQRYLPNYNQVRGVEGGA